MKQDRLESMLDNTTLPSLPAVAMQIIQLVQNDKATIRDIASVIQTDPALSGKILKTVNSSFYGLPKPCGTISQALVILGLNAVKTLALGFTLVSRLKTPPGSGFDPYVYWRRSLHAAVGAKVLAQQIEMNEYEEAFLGGLLQDMGMFILHSHDRETYNQLLLEAGDNHRRLRTVEEQRYNFNHAVVGAELATRWRLPSLLIAPIRFHETLEAAPPEILPLVQCVALGNDVADVMMSSEPEKWLRLYRRRCREWFDLPAPVADGLLHAMQEMLEPMRALLDVPTGEFEDLDRVMAKANEALGELALKQQHETKELEERNRRLATQAKTDSLTHIANRRFFDEKFSEFFDNAMVKPCNLMMLDLDHFKIVNDTYGHQVGDGVLMEVARTLQEAVGANALVARYGGEEFAVIASGMSPGETAEFAEYLRQCIEKLVIRDIAHQPFSVTISVGCATHTGQVFQRSHQLLAAADQALYAAKMEGRNCVRCFIPRAVAA